jgi:hypothetical protein
MSSFATDETLVHGQAVTGTDVQGAEGGAESSAVSEATATAVAGAEPGGAEPGTDAPLAAEQSPGAAAMDSTAASAEASDAAPDQAVAAKEAVPQPFLLEHYSRRHACIVNPEGETIASVYHRDEALKAVNDLVAQGVMTGEQAGPLRSQILESGLVQLRPVTAEFAPTGYHKRATIKVGGTSHTIHSKRQGRVLLDRLAVVDDRRQYLDNASFDAAYQAVENSRLDEMTPEEHAAQAPAQAKLITGAAAWASLPSALLYAEGSTPLAQFFSTQGGQLLLCLAIDDGVIKERDRNRLVEEINALGDGEHGLPETSDVDTMLAELSRGNHGLFAASRLLGKADKREAPATAEKEDSCGCIACQLRRAIKTVPGLGEMFSGLRD